MGKDNMQAKRVTRRRRSGRVAVSLPLLTPPPEVVFPATSEEPDSNLVTVPSSVHGCHFAARGCSDVVKESWIKLQEH
ncbi:hypothetical protein E2C01_082309 [Portunus trituberculatus]|uniref:Uncharacterized protein n=1 Tax=Portunus trituberculatus TaxID=210409 RepID=A0A5B7J195_PORTR|nr:hypothetical protein [Portunus trituberculatus]